MTFQDAKYWCDSLSDEKPFELITPIGDEEEEFFLNYAQHFWIGPGRIKLDLEFTLLLIEIFVNLSKGLRNDSQEIHDFLNLVELSDQDLQ